MSMSTEQSITQPERKWTEKDGVITFSVTSHSTPGAFWSQRLKKRGFSVENYAEWLFDRMSTNYTMITEIIEIVVLKGELFEDELFSDNDRTTDNICAEAKRRGLTVPHLETACLIREKFTDEELTAMGLGVIIVMHCPTDYPGGFLSPRLIGVCSDVCSYNSKKSLDSFYYRPSRWFHDCGFAFVALKTKISS